MPIALSISNLDASSWICFVLGGIVLLVGLYLGLRKPAVDNKKALDEAKAKITELTSQLQKAKEGKLEDGVDLAATAEGAKSAIEQVGGIVAALPENQRFAGLLILIGTVLMGVGTVQFGGTSLF